MIPSNRTENDIYYFENFEVQVTPFQRFRSNEREREFHREPNTNLINVRFDEICVPNDPKEINIIIMQQFERIKFYGEFTF